MIPEMLEREALLIGNDKVRRLMRSTVMVVGIGGVGASALEALVRAGVGRVIAVDSDTVSTTNINRQLIADTTTVGMLKTEAARVRMQRITPDLDFLSESLFVTRENVDGLIKKYMPDYIIDAIDTISSKTALIVSAKEHGVRVISSMGTGNKLDPEKLRLSDIYKTRVCPLARVMRRELKENGIEKLTVLYSEEEPIRLEDGSAPVIKDNGRNAPGSISFVPSVGGLIIASRVVRDLIEAE